MIQVLLVEKLELLLLLSVLLLEDTSHSLKELVGEVLVEEFQLLLLLLVVESLCPSSIGALSREELLDVVLGDLLFLLLLDFDELDLVSDLLLLELLLLLCLSASKQSGSLLCVAGFLRSLVVLKGAREAFILLHELLHEVGLLQLFINVA